MRLEDRCTKLNGTLSDKLEGNREYLQGIQVLVPLFRVSLNTNVCGLRCCLRVGYSDVELPLEKRIFLDTWYIIRSND